MLLNATSFGALALAWLTEHMAGLGGLVVMLSVAALNIAKAVAVIRKSRNDESK